MKKFAKIFAVILAAAMAFSMVACNDDPAVTTPEPAEQTPAPTPAPTDAPTEAPTEEPTQAPTEAPTEEPTEAPTDAPTEPDARPADPDPNAISIISGDEFIAKIEADPAGSYVLDADITLSKMIEVPFTGTLHGKGHTITISNPVFLEAKSPTFIDIKLAGKIEFTITDANDYNANKEYWGSLVRIVTEGGAHFSFIESSVDITDINAELNKGVIVAEIGGIVGRIYDAPSTMEYCTNNGDIIGGDAGGLIGSTVYASLNINNCTNNGNITSYWRVGGLISRAFDDLTYTNCVNNGNVTTHGTGQYSVAGGIAGYMYRGIHTMINCKNTGNITGGDDGTGGLGGHVGPTAIVAEFNNCENSGNVLSDYAMGGILGDAHIGVFFEGCKNTGAIGNEEAIGFAGSIMGAETKGFECDYTDCDGGTNLVKTAKVENTTNLENASQYEDFCGNRGIPKA